MLKQWLSFSRGERFGLALLFFLICFAAIFPYIYQMLLFDASFLVKPSEFYRVDSFFSSLTHTQPDERTFFSFTDEEKPPSSTPELFRFNPNTVSTAELVRLGFTAKQASVIDNYRMRGGVFRTPNDFAKMYVVDSSTFNRLKHFIDLPALTPIEKELVKRDSLVRTFETESLIIELNSTDTIELVKLKGIGRGYARRIISFRNNLGGFVDINQLLEIYGFPPTLLETLRPNLTIDITLVKKININTIDYNDLRKHPYLTEYQARAIIYYRETVGNYKALEELTRNKLLDESTFNKIHKYLTTN